ncbi:MAG: DUF2281 domain-containing protein [Magnetococcus sp. DMHC-1]|nr:DUF2281 domain-containing protein [Magnetococcales bacterium]
MGETELMEKLRSLPHEKQAEVYDFVEFLSERYLVQTGTGSVSGKSGEGTGVHRNASAGTMIRPPKPMSEEEIKRIFQAAQGAWGPRTLEETDALIQERRRIDWGDNNKCTS